jgi:hypothetical protein
MIKGMAMASSEEAINQGWESVFGDLTRLRERWLSPEWTYDRRLKCVASSIPLAQEAAARAAIGDIFPTTWTGATLPSAPEDVRALAGGCGGLRAAQQLLWNGAAGGPGAFGLWWPWGDGTTVTLRVGLHHLDLPKVRYPRLRDVFGIPQAPPSG